jgi:phospholipid/cholesterol/gamma-HCH transport system substrate-binding protein
METRANYLLVGLFILLFTIGLLAFVVWLAKFQVEQVLAQYDVIYEGSVTGLKEGSPVRFSGVRVGQVTDIGLDPENPSQVRVSIEIEKTTPVRSDTEASLELEGLTGGRYILLHGGSPEATPLRVPEDGSPPVISARSSTLERVLEGAPDVLKSVNVLLTQANDLLNDRNRELIAELLENLATITSSIAGHRDAIQSLVGDTAETMENLKSASQALEEMAIELRGDAARLTSQAELTLASVESLTANADDAVVTISGDLLDLIEAMEKAGVSLDATAREIQSMVAENREPLRDFSSTGLYEFSALLTEARKLVRELNRVTTDLQRDPARFFFGNRQEGYETPP